MVRNKTGFQTFTYPAPLLTLKNNMRESVNLISGLTRVFYPLLTSSRSHQGALIIFSGMGLVIFFFDF
ncbi:MAG: hypothetical protein CM1200mP28_08870 [Deltaproteobacteria bacterium]|nr:MAG: hypothetical protein CM1200mP28_08870 [Deltaproteobacteria bacterium]